MELGWADLGGDRRAGRRPHGLYFPTAHLPSHTLFPPWRAVCSSHGHSAVCSWETSTYIPGRDALFQDSCIYRANAACGRTGQQPTTSSSLSPCCPNPSSFERPPGPLAHPVARRYGSLPRKRLIMHTYSYLLVHPSPATKAWHRGHHIPAGVKSSLVRTRVPSAY